MGPTNERGSLSENTEVFPHATVSGDHASLTAAELDEIARAFSALPPIFRECCDQDNLRFDLRYPFVVAEHTYATDGRIAVRSTRGVPEATRITQARWRGRTPRHIDDYFNGPFVGPYATVPSLSDCGPCRVCKGARKVHRVLCEECGDRANLGCTACYGRGYFPTGAAHVCYACNGCGLDGWDERVAVQDFLISRLYLERIIRHGGSIRRSALGTGHAHRFDLPDGTQGAVMPMRGER